MLRLNDLLTLDGIARRGQVVFDLVRTGHLADLVGRLIIVLRLMRDLKARNPANARFSILERVSSDMPAHDVIALEQTWMDRLHTRRYGLNA